jgi:hypothetical protein
MEIGNNKCNIVFWGGISEEAVDALNALVYVEKRAHWHPCTPLIYLIDGAMVRLPIARKMKVYKKPHWCPMTLNRGPFPTGRR